MATAKTIMLIACIAAGGICLHVPDVVTDDMNHPALVLYAECIVSGRDCRYSNARITGYIPAWGGINCDHDCSIGAWSIPLQEDISAACGPSLPFETKIFIFTPWGEVFERLCHDRGGMVHDWVNVDVYMTPEQHEERPLHGYSWPVVWELPDQKEKVYDTPKRVR